MSVEVDIKALLAAGLHFGHKTSRWHPKMASYIHSKRGDSHIIDLTKTVEGLDSALTFLSQTTAAGRQVLLVGTKRQAKDLVKAAAVGAGQPYVTERWLGGTLTNVATIGGRIKHLKLLEKRMGNGELDNRFSKLEVQRYAEEIEALNIKYGGIKELSGKPGAMVVIDVVADAGAVREARRLGIPVVGLVDTNANPTPIDYVIAGNDDAIKGIALILDYVVAAIAQGAAQAKKAVDVSVQKAEPRGEQA